MLFLKKIFAHNIVCLVTVSIISGTSLAFGDGIYDSLTAMFIFIGFILLCFEYEIKKQGSLNNQSIISKTKNTLLKYKYLIHSVVIFGLIFMFIHLLLRPYWVITFIAIISAFSGLFCLASSDFSGSFCFSRRCVSLSLGPIILGLTYYAQSFEYNYAIFLAGLGISLISTSSLIIEEQLVMILHNKRMDNETSRVNLYGIQFKLEYVFYLVCAGLLPVLTYFLVRDHILVLLAAGILLLIVPLVNILYTKENESSLIFIKICTNGIMFVYGVVYSIGWIF